MTDAHGAATYSASYSSKADEPDSDAMFRTICVVLGRMVDDNTRPKTRDFCRILLNSVLSSTKVGMTQIAWNLLGFKLVQSSRDVITVNAMPRHQVHARVKTVKELKRSMEVEGPSAASVDDYSPGSNLGRRNAYGDFVRQQNTLGGDGCQLSFYQLLTHYKLSLAPRARGRKRQRADAPSEDEGGDESVVEEGEPEDADDGHGGDAGSEADISAFGTDDEGERGGLSEEETEGHFDGEAEEDISDSEEDDSDSDEGGDALSARSKLIPEPTVLVRSANFAALEEDAPGKFRIGKYVYTKYDKPVVLNLSPYLSFDPDDEASAYAMLLLHTVWPGGDEDNLLPDCVGAVEHLKAQRDVCPEIDAFLEPNRRIRTDLAKNGTPASDRVNVFDGNTREDEGDGSDEDEEFGEDDEERDDGEGYAQRVDEATDFEMNTSGEVRVTAPQSGESPVIAINNATYRHGKAFLQNVQLAIAEASATENTYGEGERPDARGGGVFKYRDAAKIAAELGAIVKRMKKVKKQSKAYALIRSKFKDLTSRLMMVLSGAGGTGKTEIIKAAILLAKQLYGRQRGEYGPVVVVAPSGSAAANAGGYTFQHVLGQNHHSNFQSQLTQETISMLQKRLEGLKVIIFGAYKMATICTTYLSTFDSLTCSGLLQTR